MKFIKILLLEFQLSFERRLRNLIWFLIPICNNFTVVLFWFGASKTTGGKIGGWSFAEITSYYVITTTLGSLLSNYMYEDISEIDIKQGGLVFHLLKPFSYFWKKFIEDISYRIVRLFIIILLLIIIFLLFGNILKITTEPLRILLSISVSILGFFMVFLLSMCLGLTAFWFKENRALYQLIEIVSIIFSGGILPVELMPKTLQTISHLLPYAYSNYYPIIAFQGKLALWQGLQIISVQFLWLAIFYVIYKLLWNNGIKEFTATGQ